MPIGAKGYVTVDARESLEFVEVADNLLWLGSDGLHGIGDHARTVIAERDPPQERVAHVDLGALQTVYEGSGALRKFSALAVTDVAEIVRINLRPVFRLLQQRFCLTRAKCGLADDRHVPTHIASRVDDPREKAGIDAPRHDCFRPCGLHP